MVDKNVILDEVYMCARYFPGPSILLEVTRGPQTAHAELLRSGAWFPRVLVSSNKDGRYPSLLLQTDRPTARPIRVSARDDCALPLSFRFPYQGIFKMGGGTLSIPAGLAS